MPVRALLDDPAVHLINAWISYLRADNCGLKLIAISSSRPILSVEKELGVTPLPLPAEFSPF